MKDVASHAQGSRGTIFTIGHSTRTLSELMDLLREAEIELLVDVRSVPRSRTNPQFNIDAFPKALATAGLATFIYPRLAACALAARPRWLPPMRFGRTHPSEIMPITPGLRRSGWE